MDKEDPAYGHPKALQAEIFFNGSSVAGVITADEEEGLLVAYAYDEKGLLIQRGDQALILTLEGEVKITFPTLQ